MRLSLVCIASVLLLEVVSGKPQSRTPPHSGSVDKENGVIEVTDSRCNSPNLHAIMVKSITDNLKETKFAIMELAEEQLGGNFNVICAHGDFNYIINTRLYCLAAVKDVRCYAFLAESAGDLPLHSIL